MEKWKCAVEHQVVKCESKPSKCKATRTLIATIDRFPLQRIPFTNKAPFSLLKTTVITQVRQVAAISISSIIGCTTILKHGSYGECSARSSFKRSLGSPTAICL